MKIATWNINSIRLRKEIVKKYLELENIDILLLQETKCVNEQFPCDFFTNFGFKYQYFEGEKSYNGVAILSKIELQNSFSLSLCNEDKRHISAQAGDIEIHNFYIPAGGDVPSEEDNPKFKHKLNYVREMRKWFSKNRDKKDKMILCGDLNIAPFEHDVWSSKQLRDVVSHTNIERKLLLDLVGEFKWVDCARKFTPSDEKSYSWWSYRNKDWKKSNRGRRLDHIWTTDPLNENIKAYNIFKDARDWEKPSDHIPLSIKLDI